ncbi:MAG: hypothetical protein U1F33_08660 [Alphaproteobacteria bacterium]
MPPRTNPLKLNALQLKTLTLLQEIARTPGFATPLGETGEVVINHLPHAHGDHFHIGPSLVMAHDATGLHNQAVWMALDRKGLVRSSPEHGVLLTKAGVDYATGLADTIIRRSSH